MIEFRALGPAELVGPEGTDTRAVLARPKLLGLLAFLSVGSGRGFQRRDSLIGMFWAELDQARARSAVRQSLYRLRLYLGEDVVVTRGDDEVAVSETEFWSDVQAFENALSEGDRAAALELYRGDLLDGFYVSDAPEFERWLDERRKQLRQSAATAAWESAEREAQLRHTSAAGRWSRQARKLSPLDERLLQRVIGLLDRLGDRAGAVREYETFARRFADELELEPSPETEALVDGVRARTDVVRSQSQASPPESAPSPIDIEVPTPRRAAAEASSGQLLGDRYRLKEEIGIGGMATVYRARDLRHERDVALKLMHPDLAAHVGLERFLQEIQIAANLAHPHIVPVHDSGSIAGRPYYVMPYVDGESLRDRLEREGQLTLGDALAIARDVAEALEYAHGRGVVHRDIKPENILLSGDHALVADFGIARAASMASEARLTKAGTAVGTPLYMSPEQSAGSDTVDGRSDVYSLACVFYEMLGGEPPFTGPTADGIARKHIHSTPRPVSDLRETVPDSVAAVIARALAKAPEERFESASGFVAALEGDSQSVPASTARVARRRTLFAAVAISVVVVVAAVAVLSWDRWDTILDPSRVLVLPLENRTGDSALTPLGKLAADWIARGLQEVDLIEVVPTSTSFNPGPDVAGFGASSEAATARAAGEATRAGTVVAGSYYRRGDSLEFQAQVIDANEERLVRAMTPIAVAAGASGLALDSLRRNVVTVVASVLDQRLLPSTAASQPPSLEAYRAYLEGHRAFYHGVPVQMRETLEFMYQAVALDSNFADPRFFMVMAHYNLGEFHAADSNAQLLAPFRPRFSPFQRAFSDWLVAGLRGDRVAALQATRELGMPMDIAFEALNSNRPNEAIAILSEFDLSEYYFRWRTLMEALHMVGDYPTELRQARRAREAYPDQLMMLAAELRALAALGRIDDVAQGISESLLLPPEGPLTAGAIMGEVAAELRAHGYREASLGVADQALRWFRSRPAEEAAMFRTRVGLAHAMYLAERWEEAHTAFLELAAEAPQDVTVQGFLGVLAARRGDREEALRIGDRLERITDPYDIGRDTYLQATIAAQLGDLDRAMVLLREAYARGRPHSVFLHREMDLEPLRDSAPFQEFIKPKG
jgi:serine/threonine protein kinase/DNA-binding SARP family transcriptional activator/tetratricopeptide (TPR) repeat protein